MKKILQNALKKKADRQSERFQFKVTPGQMRAFKKKHGADPNKKAKALVLGSIDEV